MHSSGKFQSLSVITHVFDQNIVLVSTPHIVAMHFHARTSMLCHPKQTVLSNGKASLLARGESLRAVLQWKSAVTFLKKILSAFRASASQFAAKRANCKCKKFSCYSVFQQSKQLIYSPSLQHGSKR